MNQLTLILINALLVILTFVLAFFIFMLFQFFWGAPFEPSNKMIVRKMIKLSGNLKGKRAVDLGSGDGRIVCELAKEGADAYGIENNPFLVAYSRTRFLFLGRKAKIIFNSFWGEDLRKYDIILLFQVNYVMERLGVKIKRECRRGTLIVSHHWKFPNLKLKKEIDDIYVYEV
ncbi:MAG: hypothetical protein AABX48_01945 [Nanoarchaeota archaeon]